MRKSEYRSTKSEKIIKPESGGIYQAFGYRTRRYGQVVDNDPQRLSKRIVLLTAIRPAKVVLASKRRY
jgi:hypothetical protein